MADMQPSLATATSTRVDSGCKHIQQCRVSQDHMQKFVLEKHDDLIHNKYGYAVHKDELVLNIRECWYKHDKLYGKNAYPRVVSNLGRLGDKTGNDPHEAMKFLLYAYHNLTSLTDRRAWFEAANETNGRRVATTIFSAGLGTNYMQIDELDPAATHKKYKFQNHLNLLHDFTTVGYANTVGFAHAHHGDTMTSVHIGGLRTVMNGDFSVECGDKIQWYWPDEKAYFNAQGVRLPITLENVNPTAIGGSFGAHQNQPNQGASDRENFYSLQFGQKKDHSKYVPRIKTYKEDEAFPRIYDSLRVFAVAISSARPHEMFDIMIARQAI